MEEDDETVETTSRSLFFTKRAQFIPKKSPEELRAASELLNKIQEEKAEEAGVLRAKTNVPKASSQPRKGRSRKTKKASPEPEVKEIENVEDVFKDEINTIEAVQLSAAAKRRLKKLQRDRLLEQQNIEAENQKILSAVDTSETHEIVETPAQEDDFEKLYVLTISYLSDVSRLKCYENEKFSTIFPKVAELFKMKVTEFLLCHREKNISLDDTPKTLNLGDLDVLECIPYKADDESTSIGTEYDVDKIKISFQSNDVKEKTDMFVHKVEKLRNIMERYAKLRNLPLDDLTFEFDGEALTGDETPEELDMESGNCIDVRISSYISPKKSRRHLPEKTEPVITVDSDGPDPEPGDCTCIIVSSATPRRRSPRKRGRPRKKSIEPVITVGSDSNGSDIIICRDDILLRDDDVIICDQL